MDGDSVKWGYLKCGKCGDIKKDSFVVKGLCNECRIKIRRRREELFE